MNIQNMLINLIINLIPVVAIAYLSIGIIFLRKDRQANLPFALLMFASALYSFGYYLELNVIHFYIALTVRNIEFLGTVFIPAFGLWFIWKLARGKNPSDGLIVSWLMFSAVLWILLASNPYHHWFYRQIDFAAGPYFTETITTKGIAFYVMLLYYVGFSVYSSFLLWQAYKKPDVRLIRKKSLRFLLATFQVTWIPVLIVIMGLDRTVDPVPYTIMVICGLFFLNEIKNDMFEIQLRRWHVEYGDSVYPSVLMDANEMIALNKAARLLFDKYEMDMAEIASIFDDSLNAVDRSPVRLTSLKGTEWFEIGKQWYDVKKKLTYFIMIDITAIKEGEEQKKRNMEEIEYLSFHDHLTGLYNRRFFETEMRRLDTERNLPISIIMSDVNGLKLINDSFGHSMGDELLIKATKALKDSIRADEIISRVGGDEFAILLPNTGYEEAKKLISRVLNRIKDERIHGIALSISFGCSTKMDAGEPLSVVLKRAEDTMYNNKLFEGPSVRGRVIDNIIETINAKSPREKLHSERVATYCVAIGTEMQLDKSEINKLKALGLLHDIGKIAISDEILNKPGPLTDTEFDEIKRHAEIGYRILSTANDMSEMAQYVLYHHEKWDGTGYPTGIKGKDIPLFSRICAIADAYDAMTSDRSYRSAMSQEAALNELKKHAGTQFDPELTDIFLTKNKRDGSFCISFKSKGEV